MEPTVHYGLQGQTAVVTGTKSGIGFKTARLLLQEGDRIVISDKAPRDIQAAC